MSFIKKPSINAEHLRLFLYWFILLCYLFSNFLIINAKANKESDKLTEIEAKQLELEEGIKLIDQKITNIDYSNEFESVHSELKSVEEAMVDVKLLEYQTEMTALDKIEDKEKWFLEYKDICERYDKYIGKPMSIYDVYTEEEVNLVMRMVETEIGAGSFQNKINVADVVWNRMADSRWPNTIKEIIVPRQFAFSKTSFSESTRLAVEYSYMFPDETNGALAFHSMEKTATFGRYIFIMDDGKHRFYGEKVVNNEEK